MTHTINSHLESEDYESMKHCEICFPATAPLHNRIAALKAENARLTADAKLNDMAWNDNQAALKKQAEEIRTLKQELETIKACKHMHVKIHSRLWRASTLEEPAEYEYKAECKDCGELFSADDVDEWAEVEE